MATILAALVLAGLPIILAAVRAHRRTSLVHALGWGLLAWMAWGAAFALGDPEDAALNPVRYIALCLTGCAGVAVLGARRPHAFAWNFVVLGLFAVMVLPLVETLFLGTHPVDLVRIVFLAGILGVGLGNYLPTRLGLAASALLFGCSGGMVKLYAPDWLPEPSQIFCDCLVTATPWLGLAVKWQTDRSEFDRVWLRFRDSWGFVWGQRVRDQFNRAAENAGLPVSLRWGGLAGNDDSDQATPTLRAILQRFLEFYGQ